MHEDPCDRLHDNRLPLFNELVWEVMEPSNAPVKHHIRFRCCYATAEPLVRSLYVQVAARTTRSECTAQSGWTHVGLSRDWTREQRIRQRSPLSARPLSSFTLMRLPLPPPPPPPPLPPGSAETGEPPIREETRHHSHLQIARTHTHTHTHTHSSLPSWVCQMMIAGDAPAWHP